MAVSRYSLHLIHKKRRIARSGSRRGVVSWHAERIRELESGMADALAELDASLFTNAEHLRAKDILRSYLKEPDQ